MIHWERRRRRAWGLARVLLGTTPTHNGSLGPNPAGAQCVNVPNIWWAFEGVSQLYGNADEWIGAETGSLRWIPFRTGVRLRAGDVAVFNVGPDTPGGHVDLVLNGAATPYLGLDENWGLNAAVSFVEHDPELLAGLIRIR